jgi:S-adenosylmethionine decarboxylase proenzyme
MAATTATANAAQAAAEVPAAARRYAVDVRLYLVLVATGMALAFGLGVAYGPAGGDEYYDHTTGTERVVSEGQWQVLDHHHLMEPPKQQQVDGQDTEQHEPAGQHLLVDIKGVDSDFLNSEQRLSEAMVDAVKAGGLTLLSYHCHSLIPAGVSCVGVLLESHISFHTWPDEGVITLDLFTCGSSPLLPVVPTIEKLFAVGENCQTQWAHELRGFREEDEHNYLDNQSDLTSWVLSPLEVYKKELVVSVESPYQKIDIWDLIESDDTPSYEDSIRHNLQPGDPRWNTPELASPDRLLFLDGTIQVSTAL